jgi:hypothetical protein
MTKLTLITPVKREGGDIALITLRKPDVGSLRGLKLTDILQMDVNAMLVLLPRVTEPALMPNEVAALDPADLMTLAGRCVGFFLSPEQQAELAATERQH